MYCNWGIIGPGFIATRAIIPAIQELSDSRLVAVASSNRERAREVALNFGIERFYSDYQDLLDDRADEHRSERRRVETGSPELVRLRDLDAVDEFHREDPLAGQLVPHVGDVDLGEAGHPVCQATRVVGLVAVVELLEDARREFRHDRLEADLAGDRESLLRHARQFLDDPQIRLGLGHDPRPLDLDRDERPDVDSRYQSAISLISKQGGWPLTGFLLPDGKPFFGGTYFPPEDQMGRPGFRRVLLAVADSYRNKRAELERAADSLADAVSQAEVFTGARADFDLSVVDAQTKSITQLFDIKNGGFGRAPKFPHSSAIDLVLERYQQTKEKHLLAMAETTLEKMACGGVYDQLAGGFHRYSVDERWLVPHFEKMSYDNSELLKNYLHGWQVTQNPFLRETAEGIIDEKAADVILPKQHIDNFAGQFFGVAIG